MPRTILVLYPAALLVMWSACVSGRRTPPAPSPADSARARQSLNAVMLRYWTAVLPRRPDLSAALGRRVDDFPSPVRAVESDAPVKLALRLAESLEAIDPDALSPRDYATLQTLRWELDGAAEGTTYAAIDFSVLSPRQSALLNGLRVLDEHPITDEADLNRYLFLLDGVAFWLADVQGALDMRARDQATASRDEVQSFRTFLDRLRRLVADNGLQVDDARLTNVDPRLLKEFRDQETEGLHLRLLPAIDSLQAYLGGYATQALRNPGLWQYPGGKEFYRYLLRRHLGVEIEPEEAHRVGLAELQRLDSLLAGTRRQLQWTGTIAALHDSLRRVLPPIGDTAAIQRARTTMSLIRDSLATHMSRLPDSLPPMRVATALERLLAPEGMVRPPVFIDSMATAVVTPAWGATDAQVEGRSFVFRWTWPGTVLSTSWSYSGDSLSPLVLMHPVDATRMGWAEYSASLAGELGYYNDPLAAYGRLLHEAWNAALLVCDTGLHYYGWPRQRAIATLRPYTVLTDSVLDARFVELVVQSPGLAGAPTIGAREYAAMRAWMRQLLGARFDQRAWHEEVLSLGPVPLPVLASYLEWWGWRQAQTQRSTNPAIKH